MNKKLNTKAFSKQIRKIYVKKDNTLNRVSLFLSALAIALIVLLLMRFKGLSFSSHSKATELTVEQATQELYEYINSLNGFSDAQRDVLNSVIANYLEDKSVVTNEEMTTMYDVVNSKYDNNRSYVESIKNELVNQLSENVNSDQQNYQEITNLIQELNTWLDESNKTQDVTFNSLLKDLRAYTESSDSTLNSLINDLNATMVAEDDILRGEIECIKERTIVDDIPFVFGVQEDCYGYYTKEGTFKPF